MSLAIHTKLVKLANGLAPLPQTVFKLNSIFANSEYDTNEVTEVINLDPTLAARTLRLANSALMPSAPTSSLSEAVRRVGTSSIISLAIASSARPKKGMDLSCFGATPESYWEHSVRVLCFAEELAAHLEQLFDDDFTCAALLHDFGKLILASYLKPPQVEAMRAQPHELPPTARESNVLSVDHAEVGAVVAQRWNLRDEIAKAIQYHHNPGMDNSPMSYGLNLANYLARQVETPDDLHPTYAEAREQSIAALSISEEQLASVQSDGIKRFNEVLEVYC